MIAVVNATFYGEEKPRLITLPEQPSFLDVKYVTFTNRPDLIKGSMWDIVEVKQKKHFRKKAREIKTNIHEYVPEADYWLWMDNNCKLRVDPNKLLSYINNCDIAVMPHPERSNIIEEANVLFKWKPEQSKGIQEAINKYYQEGYVPSDLYETKVLLRRNNEKIRLFNSLWWEQIKTFSIRDQISFPYVSWKTKTYINTFPGNNSRSEVRSKWKPYVPYWGEVERV